MAGTSDFASATVPRHLARGTLGFGGLVGGLALFPLVGPLALLLLPLGLLALRGCPLCWTIGLVQTLSRNRLERVCVDGHCTIHRPDGAADRTGAPPLGGRSPSPHPADPHSRTTS